jgi:phage baseplate assembly protein W
MVRRAYLGTGLTFPLQINVQGGLRLSWDHQDVREAIWIILRTELGERVYRPNFGCRLSELIFAPLNTRTLFLIKLYVQEALEIWEPRIEIDEITLDPDPVVGRVDIQIDYRIKEGYEAGSLVYPFYLLPREE